MTLQTSRTEYQRVVCYDPQKRTEIKDFESTNMPVQIQGGQFSPNKRNAAQMDFTLTKKE